MQRLGLGSFRKGMNDHDLYRSTTTTNKIHPAVDALKLYKDQPTATWYQINTAANAAPAFTSFTSTKKDSNENPKDPSDDNQYNGDNHWNVDHILELQVITEAFKAKKP